MRELPKNVRTALNGEVFRRRDHRCVGLCLRRLGVDPGELFRQFFQEYTGGYQSDTVGRLLVDLCEGSPTIVSLTEQARSTFGFPNRYLVLTELEAGSILVYDCDTDGVFDVDFEGADQQLVSGTLEATWGTFVEFMEEFF